MSAYEGDGCIEQERAGEAGGAKLGGDGTMTGKEVAEVLGLSPSMRDDFQQPTEQKRVWQ